MDIIDKLDLLLEILSITRPDEINAVKKEFGILPYIGDKEPSKNKSVLYQDGIALIKRIINAKDKSWVVLNYYIPQSLYKHILEYGEINPEISRNDAIAWLTINSHLIDRNHLIMNKRGFYYTEDIIKIKKEVSLLYNKEKKKRSKIEKIIKKLESQKKVNKVEFIDKPCNPKINFVTCASCFYAYKENGLFKCSHNNRFVYCETTRYGRGKDDCSPSAKFYLENKEYP